MNTTFLRQAGPNEKRCIIRHELGYYTNVVVGTVYQISRDSIQDEQVESLCTYSSALTACVSEHPFLSSFVQGSDSEKPSYASIDKIDLNEHFRRVTYDAPTHNIKVREHVLIEHALSVALNPSDHAFRLSVRLPAWQLYLTRLPDDAYHYRVFLCFVFAHSHSDGMGAVAFHKTFFRALQDSLRQKQEAAALHFVPELAVFPGRPDPASQLPISPSYLLRPALGHYLPGFISRLLGLAATATDVNADTWTGTTMFTDQRTPNQAITSGVEYLSIEPETVKGVLVTCRNHESKLTALLHELIARAVSKDLLNEGVQLPDEAHFISATATNLRPAQGISNDLMGIYTSAAYSRHKFYHDSVMGDQSFTGDDTLWTTVREHSRNFATATKELKNQPIGLLRFVWSVRSWMTDKIGHVREGSWGVSNLLSVKRPVLDEAQEGKPVAAMEKMLFAQPANVAGTPMEYSVISVADGPLSICITWQIGGLGIVDREAADVEAREKKFIKGIADSLREQFDAFAKSSKGGYGS